MKPLVKKWGPKHKQTLHSPGKNFSPREIYLVEDKKQYQLDIISKASSYRLATWYKARIIVQVDSFNHGGTMFLAIDVKIATLKIRKIGLNFDFILLLNFVTTCWTNSSDIKL